MVVIDSQVHIWAPDNPLRPRPPVGKTLFKPGGIHDQEPLDLPRLLREMDAAGVDRAVLVPPLWEGHRNDVALEAALLHPDRFAIMGKLPEHSPEWSRPRLADWKKQPGMLGLRVTFSEEQRPWLADGTVDWLWPEAERCDIPLMVLASGQLHHLAPIAMRHPGLKIAIDHIGVSRALDAAVADSIGPTLALARYPNVSVKVSSLPCFSTEPYPFRNLHEVIRRIVEAYGPHRCFWGSDLTRLLLKCTYREAVTMFTEELDFLSDIDKELDHGPCPGRMAGLGTMSDPKATADRLERLRRDIEAYRRIPPTDEEIAIAAAGYRGGLEDDTDWEGLFPPEEQ